MTPLNAAPFTGNIIPAARLNALSMSVQNQYVDLPNVGAPGQLTQNLNVLFPYPVDLYRVDYITGRIDHEFSSKNHFFVRMNNRCSNSSRQLPTRSTGRVSISRPRMFPCRAPGIISTSYNISGLDRASARRLEFRGRMRW